MTEERGLIVGSVAEIAPVNYKQIQAQINAIQEVMKHNMQEGTHYGTIPGCGNKPALYKPGAEKLSMMFRLIPTFQIERQDFNGGHREYRIVCTLSTPDGRVMGQGVGSCSTLEAKYRWRSKFLVTSIPVPRDYWTNRSGEILRAAAPEYADQELSTKKTDIGWMITVRSEREENPDIADQYNTVLKMAKKRAHVDATLTATAASDIFTQDIEDGGVVDAVEPIANPAPKLKTADEIAQPTPSPAPPNGKHTEIIYLQCPDCGALAVRKTLPQYGDGFFCWKKKGGCGHTFKRDDERLLEAARDDWENNHVPSDEQPPIDASEWEFTQGN
jgi:hypothetical protein